MFAVPFPSLVPANGNISLLSSCPYRILLQSQLDLYRNSPAPDTGFEGEQERSSADAVSGPRNNLGN